MQDYARAHLAKTFYDTVDFASKSYGLIAENKENHLYDYASKRKDPELMKADLLLSIANGLKGWWNNPYSDVDDRAYKENDLISFEHARRTLEGEEPILFHFLYVTEGTLAMPIEEAYLGLFDKEIKIDKTKREMLINDYRGLRSIDFFSGLSFLPLRKDVSMEKYMEVFETITGERPPFPEAISAYCLCTDLIKSYGLGNERYKPLKFNNKV